jgi:hypothetical protein
MSVRISRAELAVLVDDLREFMDDMANSLEDSRTGVLSYNVGVVRGKVDEIARGITG